jgi:hypothetical protein
MLYNNNELILLKIPKNNAQDVENAEKKLEKEKTAGSKN